MNFNLDDLVKFYASDLGKSCVKIIQNNLALNGLEIQFQEVKSQVSVLEKIDLEYDKLKNMISLFEKINGKIPLKLPIIEELSRVIPKDTWLTDITIKKNKIESKGVSKSYSKLIPLIENSPLLSDPQFSGSINKQSDGDKFTIRANIQER